MAITAWEVIGPAVTPGAAIATPGVVVNGAGPGGSAPGPTHGRGYPRT